MTLMERQRSLVNEFQAYADWEDRYKHIIALGKALPALADQYKTEDNRVKGCQSQVWLQADVDAERGVVVFRGDSDALLVRGLVALVLKIYSGSTPDEILQSTPEFLKELGLDSHLSPSRANGLHSMIKQIQRYALAFKILLARK